MANNEKNLETNAEDEKEKSEIKETYDRFLNSVKRSLADLTSLEVNTVLVSNISADHPGSDEEFLYQTCKNLFEWFERKKTEKKLQRPLNDKYLSKLRRLWDNEHCECEGRIGNDSRVEQFFKNIKEDIKDCLDHQTPETLKEKKGQDQQLRDRSEYRRHLYYLQKYLILHEKWCENKKVKKEKKDKTVFTDWERQQLRKLWELVGTEYVYAQTVMQLDGDIIARINDRLFSGDNAEELMRLHNRNVETGVNYRNGVMTTFFEIIKSLLGK